MISPQEESGNQLNRDNYNGQSSDFLNVIEVSELEKGVRTISIADLRSDETNDSEIIDSTYINENLLVETNINQVVNINDDLRNHKFEPENYKELLMDVSNSYEENCEKVALTFEEQASSEVESIATSPYDSQITDFKSLTHEAIYEMQGSFLSTESHTRTQTETRVQCESNVQKSRPISFTNCEGINIRIENNYGHIYLGCNSIKKKKVINPDCEAYCATAIGANTLLHELCNDKNIQSNSGAVCNAFGFIHPSESDEIYSFLYDNMKNYLIKTQMTRYDLLQRFSSFADVSHLVEK